MGTDKKILMKGITIIAWALPTVLVGPAIIHFAFINKQQPLFWLVLAIGVIMAFTGVFLLLKGLLTITKSVFENDRK